MARTATSPKHLHTAALTPASVLLSWRRVKGTDHYVVYRDGKKFASTRATRFNDKKVKPGERHRYAVRARGKHGWIGPKSHSILVTVPHRKTSGDSGPGGSGGTDPVPGAPDLPPIVPDTPKPPDGTATLTTAMVDRLFWRAGFGPSAADRTTWTGKTVGELVDHFLDTPQQLDAPTHPPKN